MASPLLEPFYKRRGAATNSSPLDRLKLSGEPRTLSPLFDKVATFSSPIARCEASPVVSAASSPIDSRDDTCSGNKRSPVLQLVPKCVAKLAALGKSGEALAKMVDPQPNWTLDDLKLELDALGGNLDSNLVHQDASEKKGWSWKADVADFNRQSKPFVMSAYDTDDEEAKDEDEEDEDDEDSGSFASNEGSQGVMEFRHLSSSGQERPAGESEHIMLLRTGRIEAALFEADRARVLKVQEELRRRRTLLETAVQKESQKSAARVEQVMKEVEAKCEMTRRSDQQHQRSVAEKRDKYLLALQRDHEQRSQVEVQKIRKEEEISRQKEVAAREDMERQMKAKYEAEARKAADRLAESERERKQRADAAEAAASAKLALQRADVERKEAEEKAKQSATAQGPKPKVPVSAAEAEKRRMTILSQVTGAYDLSNPAQKKALKPAEFQLAKCMVQLTATADHVRSISGRILQLVRSEPPLHEFVLSKLAWKVIRQCEEQVLKVPSFAYALAQIVVTVSNMVPKFMDVLLAQLHTVCILTVPKFYSYHKVDFKDERDYYKLIGYVEVDGNLESTDQYLARMRSYINLYAAVLQTDNGSNCPLIGNGWRWLSQVLNHLPANRYTGSALHAFLETAGFALHRTYNKAFLKLVMTIQNKFLPVLKEKDPEPAVLNRFETYIVCKLYETPPEGRVLR